MRRLSLSRRHAVRRPTDCSAECQTGSATSARRRTALRGSPTFAFVVALTCGVLTPAAAGAQSSRGIDATRDRIDATADQWFASQNDVASLDVKIAQTEEQLHAA